MRKPIGIGAGIGLVILAFLIIVGTVTGDGTTSSNSSVQRTTQTDKEDKPVDEDEEAQASPTRTTKTTSKSPSATATQKPKTGSSTSTTSATGDRKDCNAIRGTNYRSTSERNWYLANCNQASTTTSTTQQTYAPADTCYNDYHPIPANTEKVIRAGCNVTGPVWVHNGTTFERKFDNDPATELFWPCPNGCKIKTDQWGASATSRSINDKNASGDCRGCKYTTTQAVPTTSGGSTSNPSAVITTPNTPVPTATPATDKCDKPLIAGQVVDVTGCNVQGDVSLLIGGSPVKQYDEGNEKTHHVVDCKSKTCKVQVDYNSNLTSKSIATLISEGCGTGCVVYEGPGPSGTRVTTDEKTDVRPSCPSIPQNTPTKVPAGCSIPADVKYGGSQGSLTQQNYLGDGAGALLTCKQDCWVIAPFNSTSASSDSPDAIETSMRKTGCDGGCKDVHRKYFQ